MDTLFLETVDFLSITKAITDTLNIYELNIKNAILFISDNASYMIKAFLKIQQEYNSKIMHIRCFAHNLSLIVKTWHNLDGFSKITDFIKTWHKINKKSTKFHFKYLSFLKEKNICIKAMPSFIEVRWLSWLDAVMYLDANWKIICNFIHDLCQSNPIKSKEKLVLLNKIINYVEKDNTEITFLLAFLREYALSFSKSLRTIQESRVSLHIAQKIMQTCDSSLRVVFENHYYGPYLAAELSNSESMLKESIVRMIEVGAEKAYKKLIECNKLQDHRLIFMIDYHNFFDPEYITTFEPAKFEMFYSDHILLQLLPQDIIVKEMHLYYSLVKGKQLQVKEGNDSDYNDRLLAFWREIAKFTPSLSKIAFGALKIPLSSAEVERSFAQYRNILTFERQNLSEENLKFLIFYHYNQIP